MPEKLTAQEVDSQNDPAVAKQFDNETPNATQWQELFEITDKLKTGLLGTIRPGVGPVARSMAIARRSGPDFLFLANAHSKKFEDLEHRKDVFITFQDSSTQDWVSVTGKATTVSNSDPRIKEIYTKMTSAWFGDLGDGVHNGGPDDSRMKMIEVKTSYISYWKAKVSTLGFVKETVGAVVTGAVANTGVLRQFHENEIGQYRAQCSELTK